MYSQFYIHVEQMWRMAKKKIENFPVLLSKGKSSSKMPGHSDNNSTVPSMKYRLTTINIPTENIN
jgi:hypothetical protein